ncbi:MAG: response regulator [Bacteroidales bacterium]|nr:response regulator [Bacteroidales bacterium]
MPNSFINIDYNDMENAHIKLRTLVMKGLDVFLAFFILLLSFFEVINEGINFTAVFEYCSIGAFVILAFVVNRFNYKTLSIVNIIVGLIVFGVLNYVNPKNEAIMLLSLLFFPLSASVLRRFYSFVFGSAFMALVLYLYFRGVSDNEYALALPFMIAYMFLSYLFIAATMIFKYVLRDVLDSFATEKKSITNEIVLKDDFLRKYTHNIRTSLSNIIGIVTVLSKEISETQKKFLDSITASVQNIVDVMELIAIPENVNAGNEKGEKEVCDLEELITTSAEFTFGVAVKIKTEEALPLFNADTVVIRRLFLSVFDFFKRHAFGKHSVNVSVNICKVRIPAVPVKYRFDISVSDTLQFSDDSTPGYINLIEKLVKSLGGNMKYDFGEDSSLLYFNICLDEVEGGAVKKNHTHSGVFYVSSKVKKLSQANILICEDNPINQKVMMLALEKYVGEVDVAFNGKECLSLFHQKQYDIILMDIQMPVLDGYATTKAIRQIEKNANEIRHIPIIAVTANTLSGDREQCLNVGMDDYFSKPFHIEKIVSRISEFLVKYPQE